MKKRLPSFLAGFLCAILLISLTVGVYAASEWPKTIEVGHINIMVNGKEFQPTDSKGRPVDVFVYKGTTYAPLRALAEAYGLTVGYDAAKNMATVTAPGNSTQAPTNQPTVKFYPDLPHVPDYGAIYDVRADLVYLYEGKTLYLYDRILVPPDSVTSYINVLTTYGFKFDHKFVDDSGNTVLIYNKDNLFVYVATVHFDELVEKDGAYLFGEYLAIMIY